MSAHVRISGLAFLLAVTACQRSPRPAEDLDRRAMLANLGEAVILPTYRSFLSEAEALETAAAARVSALKNGPATAELAATRAAFGAALDAWQRAELYQLGPAGLARATTGGQGLRDELYAWPLSGPCALDRILVEARYREPTFFSTERVTSYGLVTLEYLLFNESAANACGPQSPINLDGTWAAMSAAERTLRRAEYAKATAGHLVETGRALIAAWEPGGGDFLGELQRAGDEGALFPTSQAAVDELFAALFYVDNQVKDLKLAIPTGISVACETEVCPEQVESRYAGRSKENLIANLRGLEAALSGNLTPGAVEGNGFDDYLASRGAPDLAEQLLADTAAAVVAVAAIPGRLEDALVSAPQVPRDAYAKVKVVCDALKSRFVTVLDLRIPEEGAADND